MRVLVAVIAYNEERNLGKVLEDLLRYRERYDIVVIDNSSTDGTRKVCEDYGVKCISHFINSGSAFGTVTTYFLYAFENGYDILCQFDGDGQHISEELEKIITPIENNEADYVIGSRFIEKKGFQSYFFRRIGITLFAYIDSILIGKKVTDVTSGARAYGKKVIELFGKKYKHEIHDTNQLLLIGHYAGARIKEVPVVMREREHGISEFNFVNMLLFPLKGIVNIFGTVIGRKVHKF